MRTVFDTNILISGLFWRGAPHHCLLAADAGLVVLVFTEATVSELRNKLTGKFKRSVAEVTGVIGRLSAGAEYVPARGRSGWVPEDPDDDKFIDAALSGDAAIIVTGDRHLLDLKIADGVEIVSARQFLDRLPISSAGADRRPR
ncbi:putative toxin-antitoxin system toxin component, PIN family [Luteitalea sp.]|uniref:putative toxin-antitoxin system toxin component, PIN family n=1 Tax=Luteitalea sp. TaxID=2004800 RepID=UPI0025C51E49|nr:putative toxin-antitoxin system toxin component, PIN family [Luteitalea sp.]